MPISCKHSTNINIIIYCDLCSHSKKACECCFPWGQLTPIVKKTIMSLISKDQNL